MCAAHAVDLEAFASYNGAMKAPTGSSTASRGPGRPREFDLEQALDKAIGVFSESGYHATSLGKLTSAMEIAEGSLYKAFQDKRGVFLAAFERYQRLRGERLARKLASVKTGRDKIKAVLAAYAEDSAGKQGRRGCLVVGSAVDLASTDPEMAERVRNQFATLEQRLVELIEEGQGDGSVSARVDAGTTGRLLLCMVQGMRVLGKTGRSGPEMMGVAERALALLD